VELRLSSNFLNVLTEEIRDCVLRFVKLEKGNLIKYDCFCLSLLFAFFMTTIFKPVKIPRYYSLFNVDR